MGDTYLIRHFAIPLFWSSPRIAPAEVDAVVALPVPSIPAQWQGHCVVASWCSTFRGHQPCWCGVPDSRALQSAQPLLSLESLGAENGLWRLPEKSRFPKLWSPWGGLYHRCCTSVPNLLPSASSVWRGEDPFSQGLSVTPSPALPFVWPCSRQRVCLPSYRRLFENVLGIVRFFFSIFVVLPSINFLAVVHYSWIIKSELLIQHLIFKCSEEERTISQGIIYYKTFWFSDEIFFAGFGYQSIVLLPFKYGPENFIY